MRSLNRGDQVVIRAGGINIKGTVYKADQYTEGWYIEGVSEQTQGYFYWKQPSDGGELVSVNFVLETVITDVRTWNGGGGFMVTTMSLDNCEDLKRIDLNDESVSGYTNTLDEYFAEDDADLKDYEIWSARDWKELRNELDMPLFLEVIKRMRQHIEKHCSYRVEDSEFLRGCIY